MTYYKGADSTEHLILHLLCVRDCECLTEVFVTPMLIYLVSIINETDAGIIRNLHPLNRPTTHEDTTVNIEAEFTSMFGLSSHVLINPEFPSKMLRFPEIRKRGRRLSGKPIELYPGEFLDKFILC